jgi:glycosyltransferase involved in cell wall biosynthesis
MISMDTSISVFFPAYNDEKTIGSLVRTAAALLPGLTDDYEIVVVNDGSSDGTARVLDELAKEIEFLRVVHHSANRGYGGALITGFAHCTKDLIFYTDGDGQYDVRELLLLWKAFGPTVDLANGWKISRSDPEYRIIAGNLYRRLIRFLFGLRVRDVDCDFRLFRRILLMEAPLTCESGMICVEMMRKFQTRGCRIVEVPVSHYPRSYGSSQFFTARHLSRIPLQLFSTWWKLVACGWLPRCRVASGLSRDLRRARDVS